MDARGPLAGNPMTAAPLFPRSGSRGDAGGAGVSPNPQTDQPLELDGFRYWYRVRRPAGPDAGPPVVIVSGALQSMNGWRRYADHFSRFTTVALLDLPGCGRSDVLPWNYGLDFLAEALRVLFHVASLDGALLVAASYASPAAYCFAQRHPERVGGLALAGLMREIPEPQWLPTAYTLMLLEEGHQEEFAREAAAGLLCRDPRRPVHRHRLARRVLTRRIRRMGAQEKQCCIHNTRRLLYHPPLDLDHPPPVPALVFTGEHDIYARPEHCRKVADAFHDGVFTTIPGADHLFHIERADETLALLDAFYRDRVARPGPLPLPGHAGTLRPTASDA